MPLLLQLPLLHELVLHHHHLSSVSQPSCYRLVYQMLHHEYACYHEERIDERLGSWHHGLPSDLVSNFEHRRFGFDWRHDLGRLGHHGLGRDQCRAVLVFGPGLVAGRLVVVAVVEHG